MAVRCVDFCYKCKRTHVLIDNRECNWVGEYKGELKPSVNNLNEFLSGLIFGLSIISVSWFIASCCFTSFKNTELTQMQVFLKVLGLGE